MSTSDKISWIILSVAGFVIVYPTIERFFIFIKNKFKKRRNWSVIWRTEDKTFLIRYNEKTSDIDFMTNSEVAYINMFERLLTKKEFDQLTKLISLKVKPLNNSQEGVFNSINNNILTKEINTCLTHADTDQVENKDDRKDK